MQYHDKCKVTVSAYGYSFSPNCDSLVELSGSFSAILLLMKRPEVLVGFDAWQIQKEARFIPLSEVDRTIAESQHHDWINRTIEGKWSIGGYEVIV